MLSPVLTKLMIAFTGIPKKLKAFMESDPKWKAASANPSQPRSGLMMGGHRGPIAPAADPQGQAGALANALFAGSRAFEMPVADPAKTVRALFFIQGPEAAEVLKGPAPMPAPEVPPSPTAGPGLGVAVVVEADVAKLVSEPAPTSWPPPEGFANKPVAEAVRIVSIMSASAPTDAGPVIKEVQAPSAPSQPQSEMGKAGPQSEAAKAA